MQILQQLRELIPGRAADMAALVKKDAEDNRLNTQRELKIEENKIDGEIAMQEPALLAARQTEREAEELEKAAAADARAAKSARENLQFTLLDLRGRRDLIKAKRSALCSPLITEFIYANCKLFDETRNRSETEERAEKMGDGSTRKFFVSNCAVINEALARIRAAITEAESLKYSILSDAEVAERLEAIKPIIPDTFFSE